MTTESKSLIGTWIVFWTFINIIGSLQVSGGKIPYDVVLPPDGEGESLPPVIMLHGLLDWRKSWTKLAPEIAKNTGRKVYAYDALNHGENDWTEELHGNMLISELENFIEEHNISKTILLGHSMGGKVAMAYSLQKPDKVEKLIVEEAPSRKANSKDAKLLKMVLLSCKLALEEFSVETDILTAKKIMLHFLERFFSKAQIKVMGKEYLMEWIPITKRDGKISMLANLDLFLKIAESPNPEDVDPGLDGQYQGDVLFLYGTKSKFNVNSDEMIPKHFPQATLVEFEGGHALHFQFFTEFSRIVSDFINKGLTTEE